jgi:hypothetical protein
MSYFADLSPHTYTPTDGVEVLNVGWLDQAHPFTTGESSREFREALCQLGENPILLHRGFHTCQLCGTGNVPASNGARFRHDPPAAVPKLVPGHRTNADT